MSTTNMFNCPITHERIITAVVDREGNTYERTAIVQWLSNNNTSPLTRNPLFLDHLTPNRAVQDLLDGVVSAPVAEIKTTLPAPTGPFKVSATVTTKGSHSSVIVTVTPPPNPVRIPLDLVLSIDNSGSMTAYTQIENEKGETETTGLSVLDIVKHGAKAVMEVLGPNDRLSIVKYSTTATVVFPLTPMTTAGKARAVDALDKIDTEGTTNIWDGLFKSMEELRTKRDTTRLGCVMLMTDGQPNIVPPRGHIPMLKRYLDKYPKFSCMVNTYGFGNRLDSGLLDDIAAHMNGSYAFIPDSGFVGTIFVNSIANVLTIAATSAVVSLEFEESKFEVVKEDTDIHLVTDPCFVVLSVGNLSGDQERSFVFKLKNKGVRGTISASVVAWDLRTNDFIKGGEAVSAVESALPSDFFRQAFFDVVRMLLKGGSYDNIDSLRTLMEQYHDNDYLKGLVEDLNGQVTLGLSEKFIGKWGKHFLLSLTRAHLNQQCLNFKDPGVQFYGGALFKQIRDEADDAFNNLPVPTPKKDSFFHDGGPVMGGVYVGGTTRTVSMPARMSSYNCSGGGCFDGEGMVSMADGSTKPVKDLLKGDKVKSRNNQEATVICILSTRMKKPLSMVNINGTLLTPWHPVVHDGEWKFPAKIGNEKEHHLEFIYNAVLDNGHALLINDVVCVTLGHGLTENKVVEHEYFGDRVVVDLKCTDGWSDGFIEIEEEDWTRDKTTGRVNGLVGAFVL